MSETMPSSVPDWQLERFRLRELPPVDMARLERALEADESLRRRLEQLDEDGRATLAEWPPRTAAAAIRARHQALPERTTPWLAGWQPALAASAAIVAVGAVLLLAPWRERAGTRVASVDETRIKGLRPEVLLFRKTATGPQPLRSRSVATAGDVVQLAYQSAGRRYGVIVSVDSRGLVTTHLPASGRHAERLTAGANVALPNAYQLDDAPRFETFYFVTRQEPFAVDVVVAAAREARSDSAGSKPPMLALPSGFDQSAFLLQKDGPR